uniref:Uncharacterized protein n=1 Tax=Anguilla anguilla TaxID=7936 RepID=A0A0E9SXQ1_ANGAN
MNFLCWYGSTLSPSLQAANDGANPELLHLAPRGETSACDCLKFTLQSEQDKHVLQYCLGCVCTVVSQGHLFNFL